MSFKTYRLDLEGDIFGEIQGESDFERILDGRSSGNIVLPTDDTYPIVRTTTNYRKPASLFKPVHLRILDALSMAIEDEKKPQFNNAMVELYDDRYKTMTYHSDQILDIADDSYIGIFSCYSKPLETRGRRSLHIKNKLTNETSKIIMENNSIILFSTETNANYQHKVVLENDSDNQWIGITFRLSKTFVRYTESGPVFCRDGKPLTLATDVERSHFYKLRNVENKNMGFKYTDTIRYTVSESDLIRPIHN